MIKKILAVIPARSGSEGLPNKNILEINGKPLFQLSVEYAQNCSLPMQIYLSTDSQKYASLGEKLGIRSHPLRPKSLSSDNSQDFGFMKFSLDYFNQQKMFFEPKSR